MKEDNSKTVDHKDWVAKRFHCSPENTYETLQRIIASDIEKYNKLSGRNCKPNKDRDGSIVYRYGSLNDYAPMKDAVVMRLEEKSIIVQYFVKNDEIDQFSIDTVWNENELECDLLSGSEKITMHQASQKIIGPLLFG